MPFSTLVRSLRLYLRSEMLIGEIHLKAQLRKLSLMFFAAMVMLMALVFLNIAGYQLFLTNWGPVMTPFILAVGNILLAAILIVVAAFTKPGPDLAAAEELRDLTSSTLENELRSNPAAMAIGGLAGIRPAQGWDSTHLLVPIIASIIRGLRRKKTGA